jgi:HSP20 family protein
MSFIRFNNVSPCINNANIDKRLSDYATHNLYQIIRTQPAINIKENADGFYIELAAPGLNKEDFKLDLNKNIVTISVNKKEETEQTEVTYNKQEFDYAKFTRSFTLPQIADIDKISATYNQGILCVFVPRRDDNIPKSGRIIKID